VLFNSYEYLIYFLPVAALGFFFFGARPRWAVRWLVVASLFFYGWWNPAYLPLIAASIGVNFWLALKIQRAANRHRWLVAGVAANLALLGLFKYVDFILRTLAQAGLIPPVQLDSRCRSASASSRSRRSRFSSTCAATRRASRASTTMRCS
jgi:D-alanyl-lipoteichoic acid acyltransferase DltB (MBOAT superfamily)